jgi:hypothetical protein
MSAATLLETTTDSYGRQVSFYTATWAPSSGPVDLVGVPAGCSLLGLSVSARAPSPSAWGVELTQGQGGAVLVSAPVAAGLSGQVPVASGSTGVLSANSSTEVWLQASGSPPQYGTVAISFSVGVAGAPAESGASSEVEVTSLPGSPAQDGYDGSGISPPAGGSGIRGWLSGIYRALTTSVPVTGTFWQATQPVSGTVGVSNFPAGAAQDGTDGTGISPPAGAAGIRGWLSGIYRALTTSVPVTGTFWQATQPVSSTPPNAGQGSDASSPTVNSTSGLTQLASFTVVNPGQYRVWNNSASQVYVAYGTTSPTVVALAPGAGSGQQGGDTSPEMEWFTGAVAVYGPAGSIVACRHN